MGEYDIATLSMQVEPWEGGAFLADRMRGHVRHALFRVVESEVELLCGAIYHLDSASDFYRAGSAPGSVLEEGRKVTVNRPGVRRNTGGASEEARLATYEAARAPGHLEEMFLRALAAGAPGTGAERGLPGESGQFQEQYQSSLDAGRREVAGGIPRPRHSAGRLVDSDA